MRKVWLRSVEINIVEAHVQYPFYRLESGDDMLRYWKFEEDQSTLLLIDGIRTSFIVYPSGPDNTQLTANLLDARNHVSIIDKSQFDTAVNAHIVKLLKTI